MMTSSEKKTTIAYYCLENERQKRASNTSAYSDVPVPTGFNLNCQVVKSISSNRTEMDNSSFGTEISKLHIDANPLPNTQFPPVQNIVEAAALDPILVVGAGQFNEQNSKKSVVPPVHLSVSQPLVFIPNPSSQIMQTPGDGRIPMFRGANPKYSLSTLTGFLAKRNVPKTEWVIRAKSYIDQRIFKTHRTFRM